MQGSDHCLRMRARGWEIYRLDAERQRLVSWMAGYYAVEPGEVVPLFHPPKPGTRCIAV